MIADDMARRKFLGGFDERMAWIHQHEGEAWVTEQTVLQTAARVAEHEGTTAALDWASEFPTAGPGDSTQRMQSAIRDAARRDADSARQWLEASQDRPDYDLLARAFVDAALDRDPPTAAVIAQTIRDPHLRERTLDRIVERVK